MINIGRALAAAACLAALGAHAYDSATVENRTTYPVTINVEYAACKGDWFDVPAGTVVKDGIVPGKGTATSKRGGCLIRSVKGIFKGDGTGKAVTTYTSSGTSYSRFIVQGAEDSYRVWSLQELTAENAMTREGKSPGFYIVNKTKWPVAVALEQVGCLYYGTLKAGEVFNRNTGAVWFTIKANIQADGKEPRKDWDCVKPVAAVVGAILISAATAGAASWAALPAAGAAGAALSPIATSSAVIVAGAATKGALTATGSFLVKTTAGELGGKLDSTSAASLKGQYAGADWPFRCNAKPSYEIVGGWGPTGVDKDGNLAIDPGVPLQILKTNSCGSSMSTGPAVSAKR